MIVDMRNNKKRQLIIGSSMQILFSFIVLLINNFITNREHYPVNIIAMMFVVASKTFLAPVVESLMIIEMKKDLARGSEDIRTFG